MDLESVIEGAPKLLMIRELIETLTGREIKVLKASDVAHEPAGINNSPAERLREPERVGWGLRYEYQESFTEKENTHVTAEGIVKTADGKEIAFAVDLHMSREFVRPRTFPFERVMPRESILSLSISISLPAIE